MPAFLVETSAESCCYCSARCQYSRQGYSQENLLPGLLLLQSRSYYKRCHHDGALTVQGSQAQYKHKLPFNLKLMLSLQLLQPLPPSKKACPCSTSTCILLGSNEARATAQEPPVAVAAAFAVPCGDRYVSLWEDPQASFKKALLLAHW